MTRLCLLALIACLLVAAACGPAPEPLPTPTPLPPATFALPGWEDAAFRTICVQVVQTFSNAPNAEPQPIRDAVVTVVTGLGLQVVEEGCDATLGLQLSGTATGRGYQGPGCARAPGRSLSVGRARTWISDRRFSPPDASSAPGPRAECPPRTKPLTHMD
jgi:hypothetical protein